MTLGRCLVVSVGLVAAAIPAAAGRSTRDSACTIVGWVRDSCSGKPVASAYVFVFGDPVVRRGSTVRTDPQGWFQVEVPCGLRYVEVYAPPLYEARLDSIVVDHARPDTLRLSLMPWRVLDEEPRRRHVTPRESLKPQGGLDDDVISVTHRDSCP
jgi:hypothetical protein